MEYVVEKKDTQVPAYIIVGVNAVGEMADAIAHDLYNFLYGGEVTDDPQVKLLKKTVLNTLRDSGVKILDKHLSKLLSVTPEGKHKDVYDPVLSIMNILLNIEKTK